nr:MULTISPECIES: hypothetical protein [Paenibacillus]
MEAWIELAHNYGEGENLPESVPLLLSQIHMLCALDPTRSKRGLQDHILLLHLLAHCASSRVYSLLAENDKCITGYEETTFGTRLVPGPTYQEDSEW